MRDRMLSEKGRAEGWISLFDGKSLRGWGVTGNKEGWTVDDGAILCLAKRGRYLYTLEEYGNFTLSIDFKIEEGVNSGIFLRVSDLTDNRSIVNTGLEVQILDSYGREEVDTHNCGAIYDLVAPSKNACKPAGEWNNAVITCRDSLVTVELNGERVVKMDLDRWDTPGMNPDGTGNKFKYAWKDLPRKGHIALQDHNGKVWFRNIKLKPL